MRLFYRVTCLVGGVLAIGLAIICAYNLPSETIQVQFLRDACIEANHKYTYLTCDKIPVLINDDLLVIPKNFETDLASIPRVFWPVVAPNHSTFFAPSILHDYLYTCHDDLPRDVIDQVFYFALLDNGTSEFVAYAMYIGVRLFGGLHFKHKDSCNNYSPIMPESNKEFEDELDLALNE